MEQTHASPEAAQAAAPEEAVAGAAPAAPFPLPVLAGVARPVVRRAWAYRPDQELKDASNDRYHWFGPQQSRPDEVPPAAKRFNLPEGEVVPASEEESDRFERGELPRPGLQNTDAYLALRLKKKSGAKKKKLPKNPFGRFDTSVKAYAYLPANDFSSQLGQDLGDPDRVAVAEVSDEQFAGLDGVLWPAWVLAGFGPNLQQFDLIATDPFGATYGPPGVTAPLKDGIRQSSGIEEAEKASPDVLPKKARAIFESVAGKAPSTMTVVDMRTFAAFAGGRDSMPSQDKVMGVSANEVAGLAGLGGGGRKTTGFEWLHLLAYQFGGGEEGPQVARNLVVGTKEANTWMIMIENLVSDVVSDGTVKKVVVTARPGWVNKELRIASEIQYSVSLTVKNGATAHTDVTFDALSTQKPHLASQEMFRREFIAMLARTKPMSEDVESMYG